MKQYLKLLALFTTAIFFLLCALSYWIDPYGIYHQQSELFPRKVAAANKGRTVKPHQVQNAQPYTLLVGNSRVELGMPVSHPFYQGEPSYNMGLPGAGIRMQYDYAMHAINSTGSVRQVIVALDFLDFTTRADDVVAVLEEKHWRWRLSNSVKRRAPFHDIRKYYAERLSLLFSLSAIMDSAQTVLMQDRTVHALDTAGFMDGRLFYFQVASEGYGALYKQKELELDSRLSSQPLIFSKKSFHLNELENFISRLKASDIDVYLIINPYQQPYLDKISKYDLNQHFANWKNAMAQIASQQQLALFDFAIRSPLVTDVVSPKSKKVDDSPYFWEPAHYRQAFGELILDTLITGQCIELCHRYGNPLVNQNELQQQ